MKKKILSLLVLLVAAVSGAWAEEFNYDFNDQTFQGWSVIKVKPNGGTWVLSSQNPTGYDYSTIGPDGSFCLSYSYIDYDGAYDTDNYLVSPQAYQINDEASINFWLSFANKNYPDYAEICIATTEDYPTAEDFVVIWNDEDYRGTIGYTDWAEITVDLSGYAGQKVWIAYHHKDYDNYELWLDNITIDTGVSGFSLTVGENEHGTVTFTNTAGEEITKAAEGQTVTVTITPDEGWTAGTVTGEWSAAVAASRGQKRIVAETTDIDMLKDFELTPAGENTWTFTMERANAEISVTYAKIIQNSWIQDIAAVTYTSKALTPTVGVKDGSNVLVEGTDYTVSYSENVNVGTATATVTGTGNYSGTASKTFTINPATLTAATLKKTNLVYDKNGQTAAVATVTAGTLDVPANAYDVSDNTATAVGNYTAKVTGKGNFTGTVEAPFSIVPADAKLFTLTLDPEEFTYNGAEQVPAVTVQDGSAVLVENTDYTLVFTNNVNAGTATVTATGQGNYTGTQTASYKINKAALTVTAEDKSVTFGDEAPAYTVTYDGFVEGEDETVLGGTLAFTSYYRKNASVGEYDITPKGLTSDNYAITFTKGTLTVGKKAMEASFIAAINAKTYTGNALEPTPAITFNGMSLKKDKDFTVDYTNNVNVGTAEVTVTGIGNYEGTLTTSFEITPKILQITWIESIPAVTYTGQALTPAVVVKNGDVALEQDKDYTLDYTNNVNAGTGQAIVTGINNYYFQHSISFTINKAEGAVSYATENVSKQVGDNAFTNELTIVGDGVVSYSSSNTDVATVDSKTGEVTIVGAGETVITATVKAGKNYEYATPTAQYTVTVAVPTGIGEVESGKLKVEGLFDLNGRRVAQPTKKGVYILNGKKVVMK